METEPYNYLVFKLILTQDVIKTFIEDNDIDLRAFMVYVRKLDSTKVEFVKKIIKNKTDIYYKEQLIYAFRKTK